MDTAYWQSRQHDTEMQDEHAFIWQAMLDTIDRDPTGQRVLDVGCNQGGFLRLLCDTFPIGSGWGYDPAESAVDDAKQLTDDRPLTFTVGDTVPAGWGPFDLAFSHEVLYVLHDLPRHAAAVHRALAPGGAYYAVMGMHTGSHTSAEWYRENAANLGLPRLYSLDDVIRAFTGSGFDAAVSRLKIDFIPLSGHAMSFPAALEYFYEHKVMFRFTKPLS